MAYDMVKYERGQVWVIRNKYKTEPVGHEQSKDRPWLILSSGIYNKSSGMVTAVPITTRDVIRTVSQVMFINDRGINNIILCEQIKSFDYMSGAYIFDYLGQLSEDIMEKVDVALSIHLGLHYSPITLNKLYDSMEAIIKSVGHMQKKADTPRFTDDDVLQFAEKLQRLAGTPANDEISATNERVEDSDESSSTAEPNLPLELTTAEYIGPNIPEQDTIKKVEVKPRRNNRWTKEKCEEFLEDDKTMPMAEVMKKWHISKKTRYYSMKNYVRDLLKKMN